MQVLVVNVGSTSLKFRLFRMEDEEILAAGRVERVGSPSSPFNYRRGREPELTGDLECPDQRAAVDHALKLLTEPASGVLNSLEELDAVGFKPVHAKGIADSVLITDQVIAAMEEYTSLAPAHNPPYIQAFRIFREILPEKPLVGVFEPAFHKTIPEAARTYGIPFEWSQKHSIRRYGFHGASHRYVSLRAPQLLGNPDRELRIISCHLGGSSSVCALKGGVSVETSMGFSPQSGLPNATRNGDLDPFVLLYLLENEDLSPGQLRERLVKDSGLKGISGVSGDVRDLEEAAGRGNPRAALALDVLVHETRKYVGAYAAVLGGLDALVFTGGIGENGIAIRRKICQGLEFLGIHLDAGANDSRGREGCISAPGSPAQVLVILANEELVIARETAKLVGSGSGGFLAAD
jgi:acetate kinase